ncbi:MAG: nuclease [Actinomycetota bacterium]
MAGRKIHVPEIAHYEVRRELARLRKIRSIRRLDALIESTSYLPLNTATILRACERWAQARQRGLPTASADALDADVILAAQTERAGGVVATHNIGHLSRFVDARHWRDI